MKKLFIIFVLIFIAMVVYCENMPLSIIYPGELLENATVEDQRLVIDTLKTYLDRSNKIESIVYSIEMPSVLLLAKEGKLSSEEIRLSASIEDKIKVGKIMGYDYLILPEIMRNDKNFEININVYDLKKGRMQSYGAITRVEPSKFDSDINSAVSGMTIQMLRDIFNETPSFDVKGNKIKDEEEIDLSTLKPKELAKMGDKSIKNEDITQGIIFYTKAIDKDPDNPQWRLSLANAYYLKQMYKEALDQYYNAVNMGYRGEDLYKLKQKYELKVRAGDYVKPIDEIKSDLENNNKDEVLAPPTLSNPSGEFNKQIETALNNADAQWKVGKISEAIKSYATIVQKYPYDYRAYERIALVYANNTSFADSAGVIDALQNRNIDYNNVVINNRVKTFSAIISAYYLSISNKLKETCSYVKLSGTNDSVFEELKIQSNKIYESMELINTLGKQSNSFHLTNLKLTGNLINSAISSIMDYIDDQDADTLASAENFLNQAEIRTKQIKY